MHQLSWLRRARGARVAKHIAMLVLAVALSLVHRQASAQQFTFRHYGQQDGLANLAVTCLLQDHVGFVWMCTENGLFRHDGTDFERFGENEGIENTAIHSAVEDGRGRLWVGTAHDLYVSDGRRFRAVRPRGHYIALGPGPRLARWEPDGLLFIEHERLFELHAADGGWDSAPFFTPEQRAATPALDHLTSVSVDRNGGIWLGCGTGLCAVDRGIVRSWQEADGVPEDTWLPSLLDHAGDLWFRGQSHVVVLRAGADRFELRDPPHAKLTADIVYVPLVEDRDGRIVTRSDAGLARWQQGRWEELTQANGLPSGGLYAALVGRDGAIWLGGAGRGVARWQGYESFSAWTTAQGFGADAVWSVLRSARHGLVLGTRAGCYRIDEVARRAVPCQIEGLPSGEIQVMAERKDGSLWIGMTTGELLRVAANETRASLIATLPLMRKIYVDVADRLWISSNTGVFLVAPGTSKVIETRVPETAGEITDITEGNGGTLWAASQAGILRWVGDRWSALELEDEHARAGFGNIAAASDGTLWAGGFTHGVAHLHVDGDRIDRAEWVAEPMIAQAAVYFTLIDPRGWLWLGTDSGVAVFDGRLWRRFTQPDGLIWNDVDQNAAFVDVDGTVWVGTSGGLAHIEHLDRLVRSPPIALQVTRATLGSRELDPATSNRFAWDPNAALDLHVSDLEFADRRPTVVKVRLRGLSDDWFETRGRDLHYPALAPGRYEFEAVAMDRDHQRTSELVHFRVEILPPWWRTLWFQCLVAAAAAAALAGLVKWRMRKLEAHRRQLEERLKEREALLLRATRDGLTGLWNRTAILEILESGIMAARQQSTTLAVAIIDIDHFKRINDTRGHLGGDEVLRTLGTKLVEKIRATDSLGRYGGEEFLLVMPGAVRQRPFLPLERLRRSVAEIPFSFEGTPIPVTASFGVAWLEPGADGARDLLARADAALYAAKYGGRNRVEYAATG